MTEVFEMIRSLFVALTDALCTRNGGIAHADARLLSPYGPIETS